MPIRLRLLGRPQVDVDGVASPLPAERRVQLLVLLALRRGWVDRGELAALFWPRVERPLAAANVRKALHFARALPWAAALEAEGSAVRFVVDTDVHDIELALAAGRVDDAWAACRGPLLDGLDDPANAAWSDWLDAERAQHARRWQTLTRARLEQLQSRPRDALAFARELLDADALDEDAVVALLSAQRALGAADEQQAAYRRYAMRLDDELGVAPSMRVRRLLAMPAGSPAPADAAVSHANGSPGDGFIGRGDELRRVAAALERADCRLLSIVGPGGVGKSALLKHALKALEPRFADGALWIALDDLADDEQVLARIAAECRVATGTRQDLLPLVAAHLAPRRQLLLLDNAEHLPGLPRLVDKLLAAAPQLKVCTTSRVRLGCVGEWLLPLKGLATARPARDVNDTRPARDANDAPPARDDGDPRDDGASGDAHDALASDSARLFVAAASALQPEFDPRAQAGDVAALVRAVDGLPLAILIAAKWVRVLPVAEIVAELARSLDVLDSGDDSGDERPEHRSMRATIERSWQLLATREQLALAALSVFVGGFSRDAARDVARAALPLLASLADKSLLQLHDGGRCTLHPLIRQYATDQLDGSARDDAERRHAGWFLAQLARSSAAADAADQATLQAIGLDLENFRQAWRWAIRHGAIEQLAAAAAPLRQYFAVRARVAEGLALMLEARRTIGAQPPPAAAAALLAAIAQQQYRAAKLDAAEADARQALHWARAAGHRGTLVRCLSVLGTCSWQRGDAAQSKRYFEQAMRHAQACGDARGAAMAQGNLALAEKALGNYARARRLLEEWLGGQREQGEWLRVAIGLNNLAFIAQAEGDWAAGRRHLSEALALCERHALSLPRLALVLNLAIVQAAEGDHDAAERAAAEVAATAAAEGMTDILATAHNQLIRIALRRGDLALARRRLYDALPHAVASRNDEAQLDCVFNYARLCAAAGDADAAAPLLRYVLARPGLEPMDRRDALAALASLPSRDAGASLAPATPLADVLQRVAAGRSSDVPG